MLYSWEEIFGFLVFGFCFCFQKLKEMWSKELEMVAVLSWTQSAQTQDIVWESKRGSECERDLVVVVVIITNIH